MDLRSTLDETRCTESHVAGGRDALRIAVGKRAGAHKTGQAQIHALMLDHARAGRRVVRLKLLAHGRSPATPVALIENGTRPDQRVLTGSLGELVELVGRLAPGSPALIVIGEVARLAGKLGWFGGAVTPACAGITRQSPAAGPVIVGIHAATVLP